MQMPALQLMWRVVQMSVDARQGVFDKRKKFYCVSLIRQIRTVEKDIIQTIDTEKKKLFVFV